MRLNSLAFRLFATAAVWTMLILPLAGLIDTHRTPRGIETNEHRTLLVVRKASEPE